MTRLLRILVVAALAVAATVALSPAAGATAGRASAAAFAPRPHLTPAVLFIHGGGWERVRERPVEVRFAARLANDTGWLVVNAGYSTPRKGFRTEPRQILRELRLLRAQPGVDPERLYLWGESAGGNLALTVAYRHPRLVSGVVSVSSPTDLVTGQPTEAYAADWFEGETLLDSAAAHHRRYVTTSPVYEATPDSPPTFVANGGDDPVVPASQAGELTDRLSLLGVDHQLDVVAGNPLHATFLEPKVRVAAIRFLDGLPRMP